MDYDNFDISLGIRKNGKLVNNKKEKKVLVKLKQKEVIKLEDQKDNIKNEKSMGISVEFDETLSNLFDCVKPHDDVKDYDEN